MGINLSKQDKQEVFGSFDPDKFEDETKEKYGKTNAYKQSQEELKIIRKTTGQNID